MIIPETAPIEAFLGDHHASFAESVGAFAAQELAPRAEPPDDAAARREARVLLERMGEAGWLEPIRRQDWRACCIAREALAAAERIASV